MAFPFSFFNGIKNTPACPLLAGLSSLRSTGRLERVLSQMGMPFFRVKSCKKGCLSFFFLNHSEIDLSSEPAVAGSAKKFSLLSSWCCEGESCFVQLKRTTKNKEVNNSRRGDAHARIIFFMAFLGLALGV